MKNSGFTLSELLIALAILGLIATFTIPKILQSTSTQSRDSVLKETISSIGELFYTAHQLGGVANSNDSGGYILDNMNFVTYCPSDSEAEGCWDTATQGTLSNNEEQEPGGILANGASLTGIRRSDGSSSDNLVIDWNGLDGPNQIGQDQLMISLCYNNGCNRVDNNYRRAAGLFGPTRTGDSGTADNLILYSSLYN